MTPDPVVVAVAEALGAQRRGDTAGVRAAVWRALEHGGGWDEVAFAFGITEAQARSRWGRAAAR